MNQREFDDVFALCDKQTQEALTTSADDLKVDLSRLADALARFQERVVAVSRVAAKYDFKAVKANGFRSFVKIAAHFVGVVGDHLRHVRRTRNAKDLALLAEKVVELFDFVLEIAALNEAKHEADFFPEQPDLNVDDVKDLSMRIALADFSVFYGAYAGFHYGRSDVRRIAKPLVLTVAAFSQIYDEKNRGNGAIKIIKSLVGANDATATAKNVTLAIREKQVDLCKTLFNMSEMKILHRNRYYYAGGRPKIKANCVIEIPLERMATENAMGAAFQVPVPKGGNKSPIKARLLSPFRTSRMIGSCPCLVGSNCACKVMPEAECIVFHLHGGGFVSQTSRSHQFYLKKWSSEVGVPIFSVDYSTAPEAPFPLALYESLYAYCWMRNNFPLLGCSNSKATRVILAGDSAGANLCMGLLQLCVEHSLPSPSHALVVYPSLLCQMFPSPSRLVTFFDPLLMFPCMLRCLNAYADPDYLKTCPRTFMQELESCQSYSDPHLSPLLTSNEVLRHFPPVTLISTDIDPCLDETVAFAKKLDAVGVRTALHVFNGIPHGFLSISPASKDCGLAVDAIAEKLRDIVLKSV